MLKNINNFEIYLNNLNIKFNVIGLTETWIKESNVQLCEMKGYKSEHLFREKTSGGGVS